MTLEEAIKHCEERAKICDECGKEHKRLAEWIEELRSYQEIGTVEECREAVEKQKPKIPDYEGDGYEDGYMVYDTWICPNCGTKYEIDNDEYEHCPKCGQAIQWENE